MCQTASSVSSYITYTYYIVLRIWNIFCNILYHIRAKFIRVNIITAQIITQISKHVSMKKFPRNYGFDKSTENKFQYWKLSSK